jgi:hypothetical protein
MMNGPEKSDSVIVAVKLTNKTERPRRSWWSEGQGPRGMRASQARTGLSARPACHRSWLAYGMFSPLTPEVGAVCGKAARTDLCGGREVTRVPTAKTAGTSCGIVGYSGGKAATAAHANISPCSQA